MIRKDSIVQLREVVNLTKKIRLYLLHKSSCVIHSVSVHFSPGWMECPCLPPPALALLSAGQLGYYQLLNKLLRVKAILSRPDRHLMKWDTEMMTDDPASTSQQTSAKKNATYIEARTNSDYSSHSTSQPAFKQAFKKQ